MPQVRISCVDGRQLKAEELRGRAMSNADETSQAGHRLASISTMWTVLRAAHEGRPSEAAEAQRLLMRRYGGAIYRYLLSAVRSPEVAEDLAQEFALRLVQGSFRHV